MVETINRNHGRSAPVNGKLTREPEDVLAKLGRIIQ
jgi:hypothetical protein